MRRHPPHDFRLRNIWPQNPTESKGTRLTTSRLTISSSRSPIACRLMGSLETEHDGEEEIDAESNRCNVSCDRITELMPEPRVTG